MKPGGPLKRKRPIWEGPVTVQGRRRKRVRAKKRQNHHFGAYGAWIRRLPCAACCRPWFPWFALKNGWDGKQLGLTVVAHVYGRGPHPEMSARGNTVPLCAPHHGEQHSLGWPRFRRRYNLDPWILAQRCAERHDEETTNGDESSTTKAHG